MRRIAGCLVGFLLATTAVASPASGARSLDPACQNVPASSYEDRGTGEQARAIDCVDAYGVTSGKDAARFGTADLVSREQMATFVVRVLQRVRGLILPAGGSKFADEPMSAVHRPNVETVAATNPAIVLGGSDGRFHAGAPVTRAQMAAFIERTLRVAGVTMPASAPDAFADDDGSTHERSINLLASSGFDIIDGSAGGRFRPDASVTRGELAIVLARTIACLVDDRRIGTSNDPPPEQRLCPRP